MTKIIKTISLLALASSSLAFASGNNYENMVKQVSTKSHFSSSFLVSKQNFTQTQKAQDEMLTQKFSTKYHVSAKFRPVASTDKVSNTFTNTNALNNIATKHHF